MSLGPSPHLWPHPSAAVFNNHLWLHIRPSSTTTFVPTVDNHLRQTPLARDIQHPIRATIRPQPLANEPTRSPLTEASPPLEV
jgi:hypothetical protein